MGAFDQAARFAAQADRHAVVRRVLVPVGVALPFRTWLDTRTIPRPGGPDRTADLVAAVDDPTGQPASVVFEFQSRHDADKLDVALEEAGILRGHARHGADRTGKHRVLTALVYLVGGCPDEVLDMTLPVGFGTRHAPLIWNISEDAAATLEAVAAGQMSWGILFWAPPSSSQVVNEWISQGEAKGKLAERRQKLLRLLAKRFPGAVPDDVVRLVNEQESLDILDHWFDAAAEVYSFHQFMDVLKR